MPVVNGRIGDYEVDFHWPAQELIVETDGRATHGNAIAFERDRARDLELGLAGWTVIRSTWSQLSRQPNRVTAALRRHLG
jgi:very-short-patch-repair endonuclease